MPPSTTPTIPMTLATPTTPPTMVRTKTNPTPLDVIFILFASVVLVVLIVSFTPIGGTQPFQNLPPWFVKAVSSIWTLLFAGVGTAGTLALRRWLDRSPTPNYFVWISVFTVGLLGAGTLDAYVIQKQTPSILPPVTATIEMPRAGDTVHRTFTCKGRATTAPNTHLWLVVEVNSFRWPKERELQVRPDGTWESTVYEDGASPRFSLAVYSADPQAEEFINEWIAAGTSSGDYKEMDAIPGTVRLARVDDLQIAPK